jgi:hypothetical protein
MFYLDKWIEADKTPRRTECIKMWIAELKMMFPSMGSEFQVKSYADRWLSFDPIAELEGMVGKDKVVVIAP